MSDNHEQFTIAKDADAILYQKTPNTLRVPFLIVSEFFDTPDTQVTDTLKFICAALNKEPGA